MNIKDELLAIGTNLTVNEVPVFNTVFYGDKYEANNRSTDDKLFPQCQVAKILSGGFDVSKTTGKQTDKWNVFIFFCDQTVNTQLDTTAVLEDEVIERMRIAAKHYFANLVKSNLFEVPTKVEFKILSFQFDASAAGVLAYAALTERHGSIPC